MRTSRARGSRASSHNTPSLSQRSARMQQLQHRAPTCNTCAPTCNTRNTAVRRWSCRWRWKSGRMRVWCMWSCPTVPASSLQALLQVLSLLHFTLCHARQRLHRAYRCCSRYSLYFTLLHVMPDSACIEPTDAAPGTLFTSLYFMSCLTAPASSLQTLLQVLTLLALLVHTYEYEY
jgi:hypothetical protein